MRIWRFKTSRRRDDRSAKYQWYWQIDTSETPIAISSSRHFASLEECISNARENGFHGELEVPEVLTHPAVISCEQNENEHVHDAAPPARGRRANRS